LRKRDKEPPPVSALVPTDACHNNLVTKGAAGLRDIKKGKITKEVENIIETCECLGTSNGVTNG